MHSLYLPLGSLRDGYGTSQTEIPNLFPHGFRKFQKFAGWLQGRQDIGELILNEITADRLAVARTAFVMAEVIGVLCSRLAFRPAGGEGIIAVTAKDEAPQWEVCIDIGARRYFCAAIQAVLYSLIVAQINQAVFVVVSALHEGNVPWLVFNIACIDGTGENVMHALVMHGAVSILRIFREGFKKAGHFGFCLEAASGKPSKCFFKNSGERFIPHQHIALPLGFFVAVADGLGKDPIAIHEPCPHAVQGLLGVLLALVLGSACQHILDHAAVSILPELDGGGLKLSTSFQNGAAQVPVGLHIAGKAADIIDDDSAVVFAVFAQKR